jgi:hypothetical protein
MRIRTTAASAVCLGILAACTLSPRPARPGAAARPAAPGRCHVPANGAPDELAERGIGGTGSAARPPPPEPLRPSLGVAGIINGFGSVCLNGLEIGLLPGTTVTADGLPAAARDLRIGQQAVLAATWSGGRPMTDRLRIRHAVIGPIEETDETGRLIVAGQTVRLSSAAWVEVALRPGQFVSVSGLRTPSGDILASRIDRAAGPTVLVHGRLEGTLARPRIGALPVSLSGHRVTIGSDVVLRGIEDRGVLRVTEVQPDLLVDDPAALFGGTVRHFLIQTLIGPGSRPMASLDLHLALPAGPVAPPSALPAVISIHSDLSGAMSAEASTVGVGGWAGPGLAGNPQSRSVPATSPGGPSADRGPAGTQALRGGQATHR